MRVALPSRSVLTSLAAGALLVPLAAGCSAFADDQGDAAAFDGEGRVSVAAAFYPLQYVAERVGGDRVDVRNLTTVGQEPHDLEPSIDETSAIASADLVVHEQGFQPALDEAIAQNATGTVLDAADVVDLLPFDEEHSHEGEEHAEEEGHDHEGELDPHFWLDPTLLAEVTTSVADDLAEIDPDHADEYAANAAALTDDLTDLDTAFSTGLAQCARDTIVVSHDAFGYLGDRYDLQVEGVAGLSPDAEPTPAVLADLQELIRTEGITTVFSERLASPALTRSLASDAGVTTEILDPLEGLSDQTANEDYLSLMERNLQVLQQANGC